MPANAAAQAKADERRAKAWQMRVDGKTLREIGAALGVAHVTVWEDCKIVAERLNSETLETAAQHRSMQLQRLDKAIAVLMPMLDDPDRCLEAMDRLDKLEKRRAALLGLDAPVRQEIDTHAVLDVSPAVAARLVRERFGQHAAKPDSVGDPGEASCASGDVPGEPPAQ